MIFADTYYFIAILNPSDLDHARAVHFSQTLQVKVLTTAWVITELADGFCSPRDRTRMIAFVETLAKHSKFEILPASQSLFESGWTLYCQRPDKEWSLTDCISFTVMQQHGITEALTGDHHFEQAGFTALLK